MRKRVHASFQSLPINLVGEDYFVGDIHGAFDALEEQMRVVGFRPDVDRLISVGDLIDRGAQSLAVVDWLQRPYFHAVRGNHEQLYLQWRSLRARPSQQSAFEENVYFCNGGRWVAGVNETDHQKIEQTLVRLPYIVVVPHKTGQLVAAVHAGLPDGSSWPQLVQKPLSQKTVDSMLWCRNRMLYHHGDRRAEPVWDEGMVPGLHAVVCGHVPVPHPTWTGRFCYIETGGWRRHGHFSILSLSHVVGMASTKT